jgi:hypothetical protein
MFQLRASQTIPQGCERLLRRGIQNRRLELPAQLYDRASSYAILVVPLR